MRFTCSFFENVNDLQSDIAKDSTVLETCIFPSVIAERIIGYKQETYFQVFNIYNQKQFDFAE